MIEDILDSLGDSIAAFFELVGDFVLDHPILTILIIVALLAGGCDVAVKIHIISSSTKLMPY